MNKILSIFFLVIIFLLINSCNGNPFMNNLFSKIDIYELPSSFNSTDDILDAASDDQFLDALTENPELADEVIFLLDDELQQDPDNQDAALLLADVYLAASEADETVNNVNDLLVDVVSGSNSLDFDEPGDIITDLFIIDEAQTPAEQEAAVTAQLEAFLGAANALSVYGATLDEQGTNSDVNTGETAATAMIAGMTAYMIGNMDSGNGTTPMSEADAITALTASIVNGTPMPSMLADPDVDNADTTQDMLEAMLGGPDSGLTAAVNDGFDLSAFENMGA